MKSTGLIVKKKYFIVLWVCFLKITSLFCQPVLSKEILYNNDSLKTILNGIARPMYPLMGGKGICPNIIINNDGAIASYHSASNQLRIDINVIREIVSKFGWAYDDCLAIIIGHELWHAIEHKKSGNFGDPGIEDIYVNQEIDSDFYGLLGAHLAGYTAAFTNYDALLNMLSPKSGDDHPVLAQRLIGDNNVSKRIDSILPLYKIGTYNLLMGGASELSRATDCLTEANARLEGGNKSIEFPQFNYQLGVVHFSRALLEYGKPWVFPLEALDASFLTTRGGNGTTYPATLKTFLDESERYFQKVLQISPNHWDARLGMACVATLRVANDGDILKANQSIAQLMKDLDTERNALESKVGRAAWENNYLVTLREMKDKAALLQCLVSIIPENPGVAAKQQATSALKQLSDKTASKQVKDFVAVNQRLLGSNTTVQMTVPELSLPACDGLDKNTKDKIYQMTIDKTAPYTSITTGKTPLAIYQPPTYKNSTLLILGKGADAYIFQEYKECPLTISAINAAGGGLGKPGTGDYRYFHNEKEGYEVIVELSTNGTKIESCVKIFK